MAMFNNYPYPNYQGYFPQNNNQAMNQQFNQPTAGNLIWVQGEAGAKSYLVAPNSTVQLWDSESPTIYLKSADASGMPNIKILDYTIRGGELQNAPKSEIVENKDEIAELKSEIAELKKEIDELKTQMKPKKGAKKDDE